MGSTTQQKNTYAWLCLKIAEWIWWFMMVDDIFPVQVAMDWGIPHENRYINAASPLYNQNSTNVNNIYKWV